ncbi:hypothetical protein BJP36_37480 [Moorena producens JHB]|uniref:Uncharacterized protein n=1 Tax=Moorena producens (strain JHB) TaxID=1454205 RepID=A0A9Q9SUC6_MOOP1|nr:hypothetical protein [Moorena producens]WAN69788.1 hypothetical protein BJP36_37480 [Moorena producens JHB]
MSLEWVSGQWSVVSGQWSVVSYQLMCYAHATRTAISYQSLA